MSCYGCAAVLYGVMYFQRAFRTLERNLPMALHKCCNLFGQDADLLEVLPPLKSWTCSRRSAAAHHATAHERRGRGRGGDVRGEQVGPHVIETF